MNDKDLEQLVELLYPYIIKRMNKDGVLKNYAQMKNAQVVRVNDNGTIDVKFPFDFTEITIRNEVSDTLIVGDTVCVMYWVDIKNAVAVFKAIINERSDIDG